MRQPLEQLRKIMLDCNLFCRIAGELEWLDIEERHESCFRHCPLWIQLDAFQFPDGYMISRHIEDAYARSVLSSVTYREEWDRQFWDIPQSERTRCLTAGRELYESSAVFRDLRLVERDWTYLVREIRYFGAGIPAASLSWYFDRFENAAVIELGGNDDTVYWAVKGGSPLVVSRGFYD